VLQYVFYMLVEADYFFEICLQCSVSRIQLYQLYFVSYLAEPAN